MFKKILVVTLGLTMLATVAAAQCAPPATYVWTAPTEGSPVIVYLVQVNENGAGWVDAGTTPDAIATWTFNDFEWLQTYLVRVAGRDIELRVGPWSPESDPYKPDPGPPGPPTKPTLQL